MNTLHQHPRHRQNGGLVVNLGIGIVLGLLAALLAVFLVMQGGPFKEHSNTNTLEKSGASTDPNTPLYGPNVAPLAPSVAGASSDNSQGGEGLGALTSSGTVVPKTKASATIATAKPVETPTADPVAAIINAANQPAKPKVGTEKPAEPAKPTVTAKPAVTGPKEVKPVVAPTDVDVSKKKVTTTQASIAVLDK